MAIENLNPAALPLVSPEGAPIADMETAEAYLENVRLEIKDIESQLGCRNRTHPDGSRMSGLEYYEWRDKATRALYHKQRFATRLQQYVRAQRSQRHDARELLRRLYPHLREAQPRMPEIGDLVEEVRLLLGKSEGF